MKKNCKKQIKKNLKNKNKLRKKKLYFKWEGFDNSFNTWIDKKDVI